MTSKEALEILLYSINHESRIEAKKIIEKDLKKLEKLEDAVDLISWYSRFKRDEFVDNKYYLTINVDIDEEEFQLLTEVGL